MSTLIDAMRAAGLGPAKDLDLQPDGRLQRYRVEGDKPGSRNGWFVLHGGPPPVGVFGSWKMPGDSHTWHEQSTGQQTPEQRAELQRQVRAMQQARAIEQEAVHAAARDKAARLWATAHPATNAHPYLQAKRVPAYGIRQLRGMLVVPARDAHGQLHTLQFIGPDGSKRFLTGGRIRGCYFAIGKPFHTLMLAEGLATGSTLHQATGEAVAVCFNCGNLEPVARALRDKFPRLRLVICADNDQHTPGNPGLTHATAAARAVGGLVAVPRFEGLCQ
jgi:putative DNA primase/helicase